MFRLAPLWQDEDRLAAEWRAATPFPHLIIDDFVAEPDLERILEIISEEPVETHIGDIFTFDATSPEPKTADLRALRDELGRTYAPALTRLTGQAITRADMRAYAYRPGHYLLPHNDHQTGVGRVVAYAYYLPSPEPPIDGALELYACSIENGEIVRTESARIIEPRPNRIVFFEVGDTSLHQVREVLGGLRVSLAGWFYP